MNIITWEWFMIIGLIVGWSGFLIGKIIYDNSYSLETLGTVMAVISSVILLLSVILMIPLTLAQSKVEKEYNKYIDLKLKYYEAIINEDEITKQYLEMTDIITYNLWYDTYKDDLNNEWHLWGTSSYAKKMDYIEVK